MQIIIVSHLVRLYGLLAHGRRKLGHAAQHQQAGQDSLGSYHHFFVHFSRYNSKPFLRIKSCIESYVLTFIHSC